MVVGPEVGVSWDDTVFGHAAINFGLANFSTYYAFNTEVQVGYAFTDDWYGFLGADMSRRSLAVYMTPEGVDEVIQVGVLDDYLNLFTMGVGWQM
jgi:hypothetical protein